MLTAEVFNWTGHVLVTPRTQIGAALARKEAQFTGYICSSANKTVNHWHISERVKTSATAFAIMTPKRTGGALQFW